MNKFEKANSLLSVKEGDFIKLTKVQEGVVKVGKFHCGTLVYEPEIGHDVFLVGDSEHGGGLRTSTIAGILKFTTFWVVKTRNSVYVLELIH